MRKQPGCKTKALEKYSGGQEGTEGYWEGCGLGADVWIGKHSKQNWEKRPRN